MKAVPRVGVPRNVTRNESEEECGMTGRERYIKEDKNAGEVGGNRVEAKVRVRVRVRMQSTA